MDRCPRCFKRLTEKIDPLMIKFLDPKKEYYICDCDGQNKLSNGMIIKTLIAKEDLEAMELDIKKNPGAFPEIRVELVHSEVCEPGEQIGRPYLHYSYVGVR